MRGRELPFTPEKRRPHQQKSRLHEQKVGIVSKKVGTVNKKVDRVHISRRREYFWPG